MPLKSENLLLTVTIPAQFSAQSYNLLKTTSNFKDEQWLADGSLRVILEINARMRSSLLDRIGSVSKGTAQSNGRVKWVGDGLRHLKYKSVLFTQG